MNHPIMANSTIARPEWSTIIDPVLQKELEQHVLVTSWDKLLGMVDTVYNWGRRSSLWPLGFGLACCAIEMICTASSRFDIARFGAEVFRGSPRQADLMIVSGTVTKTMMPMIARLYDQMPEPKYVMSMGACATGGGPFKEGYNVVSGIDKYLPVDVYIPGCPPTPQALLNGLIMLQKKIDGEKIARRAVVSGRRRARHPDSGPRPRPHRPPHRRARRPSGRRRGWSRHARRSFPSRPSSPPLSPRSRRSTPPATVPPRPPRAAAKPMSKIDMIRAKARGEAVPAAAEPAAAPARRAGPGRQARQEGEAGRGPAQPRLAGRRGAEGAGRPAQRRSSARGPRRSSRRGCSSRADKLSSRPSTCATATRSSTTTSPASRASTTKTASRSTTSSTARPARAS